MNAHKLMYEHLGTQALKAVHALNEKIKTSVGYLPPSLNMKMFDTHVLPILEYNSEIWFSDKEIDDLEKIQLKFLKNMLGVRYQTTTVALLADTGRFPLVLRQHSSAFKYLGRLTSNTCPVLLKKCYDIQVKLYMDKRQCWLSRLNKALATVGRNHSLTQT